MIGSDAKQATAAERMRRCRARPAAGIVRVSLDLTPAGIAESDHRRILARRRPGGRESSSEGVRPSGCCWRACC